MKQFSLGLIMLCLSANLFAQEHQHHDANPNLTPFHSAQDQFNGLSRAGVLKQAAWTQFTQKYPGWGASFNFRSKMPHRAVGSPISFAPGGQDAVAKAKAFLQSEMSGFNIPVNELVLTRNFNDGKYIHVDFKQMHNGVEVLWSRVAVRFTQDLKIVMAGVDAHNNIPVLNPAISSTQAIQAAEQAIVTPILSTEIDPALKIFPLPAEGAYTFRPAYAVTVNTQDDKETPGKYLTYVDAINGEILYRQNKVVHIGFDVKADLYPTNLFSPSALLPLRNLKVVIGGTTYYTDANGTVTATGAGPVNPAISLEGKFIKIVTGQNGSTSATYNPTGVANGDVVTFPLSDPNASIRHMTCYYHANVIHDYMKTKFPGLTTMDSPLTARVDRTDGTCNAFYNGTSINFYTTAGGCNALSLISDVMYHEYGHGINYEFYDWQGGSFDNGAMGEGYADVWAMCITENPIIGPGFYINQPNSNIRQYNAAPKVYPQDLIGEVHADGEIIAGAWWDYAVNLSATMSLSAGVDTMSDLFTSSQYGLATGPDGDEGVIYHDILIDALQYDDDNNNLNDGTPHFTQIVQAFAKHGIFLLSNTELEHNYGGLVNSGTPITIDATAIVDFPAFLGDVKMFYREKGTTSTDSITMVKTGTTFTANFPNTTQGKIFEYFFNVYDNANALAVTSPANARFSISSTQRNIPYFLIIGRSSVWLQDFESTLSPGYIVGNAPGDNATAGKWTVAVPISSATNGDTIQTGHDHSSGSGKCAVTANAATATTTAGNADVDGGKTTLITDEIDLSSYNEPVISYWRWFSNSQGSNPRKDHWRVWGSYDNGTTWFQLERTYQPDVSWRRNVFIPSLSLGTKVKLMFIATDSVQGGGGAWVEGAVDDIEVLELGNTPSGVQDLSTLNSVVYPNPAKDQLFISTPERGRMTISLINTLGQTLLNKEFTKTSSSDEVLSISGISNGIYFLNIEMDGKRSIHRVSIAR
ncbi:MAG: T9SS type A sorting domain-containing protein [Chitinophagaceae bacterium]|nr:T9SS type A sorting domain-containing protein [Chitinophagaceae bacterium]